MIFVHNKAYKKLEEYSKGVKTGEIGGLLIGKIDENGELEVKDIMLLKQTKTYSHFEIDDEDLMNLTKNANDKLLNSILGWWHSHGTFSAFWSADDDECFRRLCNLSGMCLGVVLSLGRDKDNLLKMRWKIQIKNKLGKQIKLDNIGAYIEENWNLFKINPKHITKEINNKVNEDARIWLTCPTCNGTGSIIEEEYYKKTKKEKTKKKEYDEYDYEEEYGIRDLYDGG
jgi:proteasome lid subunit RPN8/RPN11